MSRGESQPGRRRSLIELHYDVDESFRMIGALAQDPNFRRDVHDAFNLMALIPIVVLDAVNWDLKMLLRGQFHFAGEAWHGDYFEHFWWTTMGYFAIDLLWVVMIPGTVRSPSVIVTHHSIVLVYLLLPWLYPSLGWCMGACMIVELNTWFLIARRIFNQSGVHPFDTAGGSLGELSGIRIKATSVGFYTSWVLIRLVLYPSLVIPFLREYLRISDEDGTFANPVVLAPILQTVLTFLNLKWSVDLLRSKLKGKGPEKGL